MADLPVEVDAGAGAEAARSGGGDFLRGYASLPIVRQLGLMLALAATVAVGVSVVLWMREPDYKPVTGITSPRQANAAAEALQAANIPYRLDDGSGTLMVPSEFLHQARMKIAGAGGLSGDQEGFELLDKDQGFGVSQFMETNMFRRSLEGELARSIMSINGVQHARVHLAIPKSTAFLRDQRAPTASVTVTLAPGQALSTGQVRAVMNLVAGAVSDLSADHVAVVDQNGQLLSGQDDNAEDGGTDRQLKFVQQVESKLREKVHNILLPTVGANRFTAEVAADVDFTWVEETEESFNPDQPALRSEQTMNEQRVGEGSDGGVPGSVSNEPPAVATAPQTAPGAAPGAAPAPQAPSRTRSQATRNFELDRTISHTRHQVGRITRLTVSVLVDDLPAPGAEAGQVTYVPWKEADLERLSALVKNAIGYNAARGDTVTVINSPFLEEHQEPVEPVPFWTQTWFIDIVKKVVGGMLVLALVLGLLRPLYRNLSKAGSSVASDAAMARLVAMRNPNDVRYYGEMDGGQIGAIGGQAHQSQLATVRGLVAENPARVAQVVKHWVSKDD